MKAPFPWFGLAQMFDVGYNYSGNHIKSGQVLEALARPFSTRERGTDTMSDHTTRSKSTTIEDRFWAKVNRRGDDECWLWTASKRNKGYGAFCWRNEQGVQMQDRAHRFSHALHFGPIPRGLFVLHRCDNPDCVNPAHLFLGTNKDNIDDMYAKGRNVAGGTYGNEGYERGESHHAAKLTEDDVRAIRSDRSIGLSFGKLSKKYGVSIGHVFRIVNGEAWSHV